MLPIRTEMCVIHASNCWKPLKIYTLQRKDEISLNVNVAKAEKSIYIAYG